MAADFALFCATFFISVLTCWLLVRGILPSPRNETSERSLHRLPTPRGGGLGIVAAVLFGGTLLGVSWPLLLAIVLLWIVSSADDWLGLSAKIRFAVQLAVCGVVVAFVLPATGLLAAFSLALLIAWAINLFNFIDGADGVAAVGAIAGGVTLAALAAGGAPAQPVAFQTAWLCALIAVAAAGFLPFNLPRARLFMGDGGSTVLGLLFGSISVFGVFHDLWHFAAPALLFVPFWADASFTLLRRTVTGHPPAVAHRDHLYQRLALCGLGHRGLFAWMVAWFWLSSLLAVLVAQVGPLSVFNGIAIVVAYATLYLVAAHVAVKKPPLTWFLHARAPTALAFDIAAAAISWAALFWVRFNSTFELETYAAKDVFRSLAVVLPIHAAVFIGFGLYRGMWRFASLPDMWLVVRAALTAAAITGLVFFVFRPDSFIWPRSVVLAQPILLILLMGGARMAVRTWREHRLYGLSAIRGEPVVVLGAGNAASNLIKQLQRSQTWRPVALLDDDRAKRGAKIHDVPVLGTLQDVEMAASRFGAKHAIIAMPSATSQERRRAVRFASAAKLATLTVPAYDELLAENDTQAKLRAIELEDLLGRDPVSLDGAGLAAWFDQKTVLVTGAGGSIGRELCLQVIKFRPARIVLLDISEFAAHEIHEHLQQVFDPRRIEVYVADVRHRDRIERILAAERPAIIFHAAAYKHVPMTETVNAWEAVRNNTLGTVTMAECAREAGVAKFVLVSTDKAVRATSIMGASKRLAEIACTSFPALPTEFVGVRFGNVLGSNGSVIPKFRKQIEAGGPITVTHPDMTRFFMSIPEAAQLVLQAGLIGQAGSLYVLDMGEPVKIVDLAKELIRLARGREDAVEITYTGLRLGEKMHEELLGDGERFEATRHEKVRRVVAEPGTSVSMEALKHWLESAPPDNVHRALQTWVTDFRPPDVH